MYSKHLMILCAVLLLPGLLLAGSGKIKGKVVDKSNQEALVGATVAVVGTSLGAATNVDGEFTILNVDAGTYQLKASFVGYQTITLSNVRVNSDLISEANFQLSVEGVNLPAVEIIAERPLINKSATNAVRLIDNEFFEKLPARGLDAAVAIQPGVVQKGNNIYVRGGRADETGYQLEGVSINNVLFGGRGITFTAEALEQVQVMAGGYSAEYGGATAGIVSSQLRTGDPDRFKFSLLGETDNFTKQNKQALGGFSYGYSDYTGTISGPILDRRIRFFGSIENSFYRDPRGITDRLSNTNIGSSGDADVRLWDGLNFPGIVTDPGKSIYHPSDATVSDTLNLVYPGGNQLGGSENTWAYQGTLLFDLGDIQIRGAGSYNTDRRRDPVGIANMFDLSRTPLRTSKAGLGNVKMTHFLDPKMFYEVNLNYFTNDSRLMDPDFQDNFNAYGDSAANAALGYQLVTTGTAFTPWSIYGGNPSGISINQPGTPLSAYDHAKQLGLGGRLDFTAQMDKQEIKAGGEYTRYTLRRFRTGQVAATLQRAAIFRDHPNDPQLQSTLLRQLGVGLDTYGYDAFGNQIDNDVVVNGDVTDYGPEHPVFAGGYVQDKIEFTDIILSLGLRYDYIDPSSLQLKDPGNVTFTDSLAVISSSNFNKTPKTQQISPRIGLSFPVSDRTQFHAQYGKFIQQSRLVDTYLGTGVGYGTVKTGNFIQDPAGYGLLPERTTQYEIGFAQQVSDFSSFDITAFYKDIRDQIQYTQILPGSGATIHSYPALINGDFATTQGVEFKFSLRRTNRVTAQLNYTFSDAKTTGSNPSALAGAVVASGQAGFIPKYVFPADFNETHRGSVLLDYRFAKDDGGPILEQLGLNLLLQFNSGHSFTRLRITDANVTDPRNRTPIEEIGASSTPWFFQLDGRLDKTVAFGGLNADFYIYVINLLGTDNPIDVFPRTGDPADDGWLSTASGMDKVAQFGQQYADLYRAVYLGHNVNSTGGFTNVGGNSNNYGPPRQIRFGVKLDY